MAYPSKPTSGEAKQAHSISLKVLRLSRPSLSEQQPLPRSSTDAAAQFPPEAGLAYPRGSDHAFTISPVLRLPPSFGSAFVGETFWCTLCANNELSPGGAEKMIKGVRMEASMQTPGSAQGTAVDLVGQGSEGELAPGHTLQRNLFFDLKEEGTHVLAVTVTYTETTSTDGGATAGRVRTFRKLYQFMTQHLLGVRTKTAEVALGKDGHRRWILEAQMENYGDKVVSVEEVRFEAWKGLAGLRLKGGDEEGTGGRVLRRGDVGQVAFSVQAREAAGEQVMEEVEEMKQRLQREGRIPLGQLSISWRRTMGTKGTLSTGLLMSRRR